MICMWANMICPHLYTGDVGLAVVFEELSQAAHGVQPALAPQLRVGGDVAQQQHVSGCRPSEQLRVAVGRVVVVHPVAHLREEE